MVSLKKRINKLERTINAEKSKYILKFSDGTKQTIITAFGAHELICLASKLAINQEYKAIEEIICFSNEKDCESKLNFAILIMDAFLRDPKNPEESREKIRVKIRPGRKG